MNKEHSQENPSFKNSKASEQITADDLKFIRSTLEKACRQLKPKTSNSIMWGLICMVIYIGIHFLIKNQLFDWIRPLQISLISFGVLCTIIQAHFLFKKFKQEGFFPQLLISIIYGLLLIVVPVFFFDMIGLFKGMYCGSAFIYALTANTIIRAPGATASSRAATRPRSTTGMSRSPSEMNGSRATWRSPSPGTRSPKRKAS